MCPKSHCNKEYHIRGDFLSEESRTRPFPPHVHVHYTLLPAHGPLRNWPQAANIPLVVPWSSKRGSRSCLLGHRGFPVGRFFFSPWDEDGRERSLHTWHPSNISPQPWRCHREVKLPGGTRLWHFSTPRDQRETNSCHKTSRKAGKTLDLPQLSSVHSFIHLEKSMQVHYKPSPGETERNKSKQSPHSDNLLPTGRDKYYPNLCTLNHEKCSVEQQWQNQNASKPLKQAGCPFPNLLNAKG